MFLLRFIHLFVCLLHKQNMTHLGHISPQIERENSLKWLMAVTSCLDRILEADIDPATSLPDSLMLVRMESMT